MPNPSNPLFACLLACALPMPALAVQAQPGSVAEAPAADAERAHADRDRDGRHDFDFEIGTWTTHLRRLLHPLSGSREWAEYDGTTRVRKVWNGRANLIELVADGKAGHFEGLSLRLYDPRSRQWSLNFANARTGTLAAPTIGRFEGGRGVFFNQDALDGRAILVRFLILPIDRDTIRFEQAFSEDVGQTWETNWIAIDRRVR